MKNTSKSRSGILWVSVLLFILLQVASSICSYAGTGFTDDFSSLDTDKVWTATSTIAGHSPTESGGKLTASVASTLESQRATIITMSSTFDPFTRPLTITFSGLDIQGEPTLGAAKYDGSANAFYAMIGNPNQEGGIPAQGTGHFYYPYQPATAAGYLALVIEKRLTAGNTALYRLIVYDRGAKSSGWSADISKIPTSVIWTIDGASSTKAWSVSLVGAKFINGAFSGTSSSSNAFNNFTSEGINGISYLALGAINNGGAVQSPTVLILDAITVSSGSAVSTLSLGLSFLASIDL